MWHGMLNSPLFWQFAIGSTVVGLVSFFAFAVPLTWWVKQATPAVDRIRIQTRKAKEQTLLWPSVVRSLVNNALALVAVLGLWPLVKLAPIRTEGLPSVVEVAWMLLAFIYMDDFFYYWSHRALHQPWLFKRIHSVHHRIHTPWAITGHYMHPIEYLITSTLVLVPPALLGAHVVTIWVWIVFRQWEAAEGHCGLALRFSPTHWLPFGDGARHHDFHHARVRGNYAGFFPLWDRVFGTYAKGYEPGARPTAQTRSA